MGGREARGWRLRRKLWELLLCGASHFGSMQRYGVLTRRGFDATHSRSRGWREVGGGGCCSGGVEAVVGGGGLAVVVVIILALAVRHEGSGAPAWLRHFAS